MVYLRGIIILLVFSSSFFPAPSFAEGKVLTLEEAVSEVLASNPAIRAAHYRTDAAKARIPQAKALDDPMVGVEFYNVPIDTIDVTRSEDIDYMIQQDVPFPGKRHTRGKVARFEAKAVLAQTGGEVRDVLLDLKRTYYDLYRLDRLLGVNRENQRLFRQLLGSAETGYATGKTSADFSLKTQVELSQLKNEEILLKQERITHMAHLKAILNRSSHEEIQIERKLKWPRLKEDLDEITEIALKTRPELAGLKALEQRDRTSVTVAKQSFLPDFSLQFAYKQQPGGRQDVWSGKTMINLPIFFGKKKAMVDEAKASLKATEAEYQSMTVHTHHDIEQAFTAFRAAEELVASYRNGILPQAKTTLEVAQTSYASGKVDFSTLIDAARTYKDLQMSFYMTQAMLGMKFAELERLVGIDLQNIGEMYEKK